MKGVERAFREAHGAAVATLVRVFGDITLAEDAVQDAFVAAMDKWPRNGIPPNPAGWIVTTARNRAIDMKRRDERGRELYQQLASSQAEHAVDVVPEGDPDLMRDDQLRLIFTCCHPAIGVEHQVALTLRLIGGLSPQEVARAFLVNETTMSKRLVRAKFKISAAGIPFRVPDDAALPARLRAVLTVLYLIYNADADDRQGRGDLRREAIRLARLLVALMPDEPEVLGLLALVLLCESRTPARGTADIVLLRDQDRSLWDRELISEGHNLVLRCLRRGRMGPFQLQAAIHGVHCAAPTCDATDWAAIVRFYDRLFAIMPTPVVVLNRAIAVSETEGPAAALGLVDAVAEELDSYHLLHATRGALLDQLGRPVDAAAAYGRAAELAPTEPEARFLTQRHADANTGGARAGSGNEPPTEENT
jgi:RNA polymerase sigma-70 factor (ECF subfamily)